MKYRGTALCLLLVTLAGCGAPLSQQTTLPKSYNLSQSEFRADGVSKRRIAIGMQGTTDASKLASRYGLRIINSIPSIKSAVFEVPENTTPEKLIAKLKQSEKLAFAQPINLVKNERSVNDPQAKDQYHLNLTNALQAWDVTMGEKSTVIAVVDSGIDPNHPDLAGKVVAKYSALTKDDNIRDGDGHGTHTAGIAAAMANNNEGVAGMAPQCGLMIVKVLDDKGNGAEDAIAEGITWAADHGAKVISMSFGLYKRSPLIEAALQHALDKDVVLVASAGNGEKATNATDAPHVPSTYAGVLEVTSTDKKDNHDIWSNFGSCAFLCAPGVNVLSTMPTYQVAKGGTLNYGLMSGTSMAAPCVAGVVGLIRSKHPDWNREQVADALKNSAHDLGMPGHDCMYGYGRVDAFKALSF